MNPATGSDRYGHLIWPDWDDPEDAPPPQAPTQWSLLNFLWTVFNLALFGQALEILLTAPR